jgi:tripartite-type tricarboxylate transporter receptor subunit TctC
MRRESTATLKKLLGLLLAIAAPLSPSPAAADYPEQPVRIVVPFAAGGGTDVMGRMFAQKLSEAWKVAVVVDNRPGAGGTIGSTAVARSAADGYTVLLGSISTHAISPGLYAKLAYDPVKDFQAVARAGTTPFVMTVHPAVPANTVGELIALARANPKIYDYASSGNGTTSHLCGALFTQLAGIEMTHIPYKANAPGLTDLLGGRVTFMFDNIIAMLPHIRAGKLKALAVTGNERVASLPNVPTMIEAGLPAYEVIGWFGFWVPAGTPPAIVAKLNGELARIMRDAEVRARAEEQGVDLTRPQTPDEFGSYVQLELAKWRKIIRDNNIKLE